MCREGAASKVSSVWKNTQRSCVVAHDDRAATQPLIPVFISVISKFPLFSAFLSDPLVEQLDNSRAHALDPNNKVGKNVYFF